MCPENVDDALGFWHLRGVELPTLKAHTNLQDALSAGPENARALCIDAVANEDQWSDCPAELWTLTQLESLALRHHQPGLKLPSDIQKLQNLRSLELAGSLHVPPEIGLMTSLRELKLTGHGGQFLPATLKDLRLDRLHMDNDWQQHIDLIASIPVRINVTLAYGFPGAAEDLEQKDLSAWAELQELEIDAFEDFEPTVFERKLKHCGFAINRMSRVEWET